VTMQRYTYPENSKIGEILIANSAVLFKSGTIIMNSVSKNATECIYILRDMDDKVEFVIKETLESKELKKTISSENISNLSTLTAGTGVRFYYEDYIIYHTNLRAFFNINKTNFIETVEEINLEKFGFAKQTALLTDLYNF
jgi:hypothetical protein